MLEVLITLFIAVVALLSFGSVASSLATAFAAASHAGRELASCGDHVNVTIRTGATTAAVRPGLISPERRSRPAGRLISRAPARPQPRRAAAA